MKVLVQAPMSPYAGYGNDGIGITRALLRMGADVYLDPKVVQAPLPPDVAELFTKEVRGPFDLLIQHVDPMTLELTPEAREASAVAVGWTMWEYSNFLNMDKRSSLKKRLAKFDALVGYDEVSSAGLADFYKGQVLTVQGGFWPEDWAPMVRDFHEENFYFCMVGMLHQRKDPFVAIQAFSELKSEHEDFDKHARLSLKTGMPGLHSKMEEVYPGLRIYYDIWNDETMKKFYNSQHVLLAPSRGEGKNMPALEFMSTGGAVIATNWGGHTQWLSSEYAYPLDYTLVPVDAKHQKTLNARASVEHLKAIMLHTFRNRNEVERKGKIASEVIPQMCSWDTVMERLMFQLTDVPGGKELWMKYKRLGNPNAEG